MNKISLEQAAYWSTFAKICVNIRREGVCVDMDVMKEGINVLTPKVNELQIKILDMFGSLNDYDPDSPTQLAEGLAFLGHTLPKTDKGNDSVAKKWLEENSHIPICALILEYRSVKLILRDFFEKPFRFMEYTCPAAHCGAKVGKLYPELNVFGAAATGRSSSSCPNIQQIPKRHPVYGKLCRSLFIPHNPDSNLYALDWSNQEGRLVVHFANLLGCTSATKLVEKYKQNPWLDQHAEVAAIAGTTRAQAKTINLGLIMGMQSGSLAKRLKLPTAIRESRTGFKYEVAGKEAQKVLDRYHQSVPYVNVLMDKCKKAISSQGFITTIGGRRLGKDPWGREYTGISKKIQGSAACLMYKALFEAYKVNLKIRMIVHDEFVIEGSRKDAILMKTIMENTYPELTVPMKAEVHEGKSWGTLAKIEEKDL